MTPTQTPAEALAVPVADALADLIVLADAMEVAAKALGARVDEPCADNYEAKLERQEAIGDLAELCNEANDNFRLAAFTFVREHGATLARAVEDAERLHWYASAEYFDRPVNMISGRWKLRDGRIFDTFAEAIDTARGVANQEKAP